MTATIVPSYLLLEASPVSVAGLPHVGVAWERAVAAMGAGGPPLAEPAVGLLRYAECVEQVLPLTPLDGAVAPPAVSAGAAPSLAAEDFWYLRELIGHDLDWYKQQGRRVVRPVVYVIAASAITAGTWKHGLRSLADPAFAYRPNVVAFGAGSGAIELVTQLSTAQPFIARAGVTPAVAVATGLDACFEMIVGAARTGSLTLPPEVAGYVRSEPALGTP